MIVQKSDVEGKVAVNGPVDMSDFEIGLKNPGPGNCNDFALVATGAVKGVRGTINVLSLVSILIA